MSFDDVMDCEIITNCITLIQDRRLKTNYANRVATLTPTDYILLLSKVSDTNKWIWHSNDGKLHHI